MAKTQRIQTPEQNSSMIIHNTWQDTWGRRKQIHDKVGEATQQEITQLGPHLNMRETPKKGKLYRRNNSTRRNKTRHR